MYSYALHWFSSWKWWLQRARCVSTRQFDICDKSSYWCGQGINRWVTMAIAVESRPECEANLPAQENGMRDRLKCSIKISAEFTLTFQKESSYIHNRWAQFDLFMFFSHWLSWLLHFYQILRINFSIFTFPYEVRLSESVTRVLLFVFSTLDISGSLC